MKMAIACGVVRAALLQRRRFPAPGLAHLRYNSASLPLDSSAYFQLAGGWRLVTGDWWLVTGGWWMADGRLHLFWNNVICVSAVRTLTHPRAPASNARKRNRLPRLHVP